MRRTPLFLLCLALPAACGGDDDGGEGGPPPGGPPPAGAVTVVAESGLQFDAESYDAEAGEVAFVLRNDDSAPHTLVIDGIEEDTFKLEVGDTDEGAVELEAGEYTLFCDVPGHRGGGMEATLTVE
jgi:plastocyanin